jgi:hypothetical protein
MDVSHNDPSVLLRLIDERSLYLYQSESERLAMSYEEFPSEMVQLCLGGVIDFNVFNIMAWILESEAHAKENATCEEVHHDGQQGECWSCYGVFFRASDNVCRDVREITSFRLVCDVGYRMPHIIVHSDGLSVFCHKFCRHVDVAGRCRTPTTASDVAEVVMKVLTQEMNLLCGSALVLLIDTRDCEQWYFSIFEHFFSQHYVLISVFLLDVGRNSPCHLETVEASHVTYKRMMASMPPIDSVSDVMFATDSSRFRK